MKIRIVCWRDLEVDAHEGELSQDDMAELIEYGIQVGEAHFRVEEGELS